MEKWKWMNNIKMHHAFPFNPSISSYIAHSTTSSTWDPLLWHKMVILLQTQPHFLQKKETLLLQVVTWLLSCLQV